MARVIANTFVTLDGVMQAPGGPEEDTSNGFTHGGWSMPHWNMAMGELIAPEMQRMDALLVGRGTYDIFAAHWPRVSDEDPVAAVLNRVPKHVVTHSPRPLEWNNAQAMSGDDLPAQIAKLSETYANEIQVHGSWGLLQSLNALGLIDEYRLWIFPVVLGTGKRLFGEGTMPRQHQLMDTQSFDTGVVRLRYARGGAPTYGSAALE